MVEQRDTPRLVMGPSEHISPSSNFLMRDGADTENGWWWQRWYLPPRAGRDRHSCDLAWPCYLDVWIGASADTRRQGSIVSGGNGPLRQPVRQWHCIERSGWDGRSCRLRGPPLDDDCGRSSYSRVGGREELFTAALRLAGTSALPNIPHDIRVRALATGGGCNITNLAMW